jgi:hypothetical protein
MAAAISTSQHNYCVGWIGGPIQRWNGVDVVIVEVEDRGEDVRGRAIAIRRNM